MRAFKRTIHAIGAFAVFGFIASFWVATAWAELFRSAADIAAVKQAIVHALAVFVPLIAAVGASGFSLGGRGQHPKLLAKRRRMPFIAMNGLLVMLPSAFFLNFKAQAGEFDAAFAAVQALELLAGAVNLTLVSLNIRDGLAMSRRK